MGQCFVDLLWEILWDCLGGRIRHVLNEWKLGSIYDHKASWDRLEGRHESQQTMRTSAVFQTAMVGSEMQ